MPDLELQQRLRKHSQKAASGCWLWTGAHRWTGYGTIRVCGKVVDAHRAAYLAFHGPIPPGQTVMHTCDCRGCVNPKHLKLGSHADNARDTVAKGRQKPFRPTRSQPLTSGEIAQIRAEFAGGVSKVQLMRKYDVSMTSLGRLLAEAPVG